MKKIQEIHYEQIKSEFIQLVIKQPQFKQLNKASQVEQAEVILDQIFETFGQFVFPEEKTALLNRILTEVVWGLHSIQIYQDDPQVEEIMINGYNQLFIKKRFDDRHQKIDIELQEEQLQSIIERLMEGTGRRVDRSMPVVDIRLADGSRANIVVDPISTQGPIITIRKFPEHTYSPEELVEFGMFNQEIKTFLQQAVQAKANILIAGGTSTGKTTLTSAMLHWISKSDNTDRLIVIEETSELAIPQSLDNVVRLETRPANIEGKGELTIRDLVKNALRMRPDRIIVGEARGGEAYDLLQAMNTGHPGSMTTIHANSPETAIDRLESLVLLAGFQELPLNVIRKWISTSIDLVVQIKRDDHKRYIDQICTIQKDGSLSDIYASSSKNTKQNTLAMKQFIDELKKKGH